jgi:hypothetical protein
LARLGRLLAHQKTGHAKLYALHAPEVECLAKGKAHKRYEFGVKVSVAVTNREGLVLGMRALPGNPYDGHTLSTADSISPKAATEISPVRCGCGLRLAEECHGARNGQGTRAGARAASGFIP